MKRYLPNTESCRTLYDGQEIIDCSVTESNSHETDPNFVTVIHKEGLNLLQIDQLVIIEVTYQFDSNQIMHCQFMMFHQVEK